MKNFNSLKSVLIVSTSQVENSCANNGQKTLDNENELKMVNNRLEFSGQSIRAQIRNYVRDNYIREDFEYFTEPDTARTENKKEKPDIKSDVRYDIFGGLIPSVYRRSSPLQVSSAIAISPSRTNRDFLVNFNKDDTSNKHNIVVKNTSEYDEMLFNFNIRVDEILREPESKLEDDGRLVIKYNDYDVNNNLRKKRVAIILEAIRYLSGFANQARNAIDVTPDKILIVFNFKNSDNSFMNYWKDLDILKKNKLNELSNNDHYRYFIGDNNTENSAYEAWRNAYEYLLKL